MVREYCYGIYYYIDKENGSVVYIGLDSHIDKKQRIRQHAHPSLYDAQVFNRVLQNNPDRYEAHVYCTVNSAEEMCRLEKDLINLYRPKFNFRTGGKESFTTFSEFTYKVYDYKDNRGYEGYRILSKDGGNLIMNKDYDFLLEMADKLNNGELSETDVRELSKKRNSSTGVKRVYKQKSQSCKQGYIWRYDYHDENGKHRCINRVCLDDLKEAVINEGLPWEEL